MFTWITRKDPSTHALIRRALEVIEARHICLHDQGVIILTIVEIEGEDHIRIGVERKVDPENELSLCCDSALETAARYAKQLRAELRQEFPLSRGFIFTIATLNSKTLTYDHAMVGGVFAQQD